MTLLGHPIYRRLIVFPLGLLTTAVILGLFPHGHRLFLLTLSECAGTGLACPSATKSISSCDGQRNEKVVLAW